ncbi:MAG: threonine-phosphate decarboxylase [Zoogloeaceae bacterium]|nr:threonine-phosphate decarboxylase [Zoogloeaceae bacterium]
MLEHGGRLRAAAARHRIPLADWLDLSTGINPHGYPVPPIPPEAWQRLPEDDDDLLAAATAYYGTREILPVAGSQAAIQALPRVLPGTRIGVLDPGYAEHRHAWRHHDLRPLAAADIDAALDGLDGLILGHPNNPDGTRFSRARLLEWHDRLAFGGGWLVVDEAFIDATPEISLAGMAGRPGLVILRSLGKFFGLAGARVGFVLAAADLRDALAECLGPWPLAGPSREVARAALADSAWQAVTRARLTQDGARLAGLLARLGGEPRGCALFQTVALPRVAEIAEDLARQGILVRQWPGSPLLRFGLPGTEPAWGRLAQALSPFFTLP